MSKPILAMPSIMAAGGAAPLDLGEVGSGAGAGTRPVCRLGVGGGGSQIPPLLGEHGAARVFGPQKGADPVTVELLEARLTDWAAHLERACGRAVTGLPGAGAAGGLGAALLALGTHPFEAFFQCLDPLAQQATVGLELRLARAA